MQPDLLYIARRMITQTTTLLVGLLVLVVTLPMSTAAVATATTDNAFEPETCNITLKDGHVIKITRWYEDAPSCEQQQQNHENMTSEEYLKFANRVNEAGDKLSKMFQPKKSLSEQLQNLQDSIDKLK